MIYCYRYHNDCEGGRPPLAEESGWPFSSGLPREHRPGHLIDLDQSAEAEGRFLSFSRRELAVKGWEAVLGEPKSQAK